MTTSIRSSSSLSRKASPIWCPPCHEWNNGTFKNRPVSLESFSVSLVILTCGAYSFRFRVEYGSVEGRGGALAERKCHFQAEDKQVDQAWLHVALQHGPKRSRDAKVPPSPTASQRNEGRVGGAWEENFRRGEELEANDDTAQGPQTLQDADPWRAQLQKRREISLKARHFFPQTEVVAVGGIVAAWSIARRARDDGQQRLWKFPLPPPGLSEAERSGSHGQCGGCQPAVLLERPEVAARGLCRSIDLKYG